MIPAQNIIAWGNNVPWAEQRQVEQDLIISRAIVAIFSAPLLSAELRFRGGTALNKLHFVVPMRYSEDLDLVRTANGPIGPILDGIRGVLEPWLGRAQFDQSPVAPKLRFRVDAEDQSAAAPIRLKVEINTREITAFDPPHAIPFRVKNPWFTGAVDVPTFSREEMLATKLRALLQRDKGRDLFDLAHALDEFKGLDAARLVACFGAYLEQSGQALTRAGAGAHVRQACQSSIPHRHAAVASSGAIRPADRRFDEGRVQKGLHADHRPDPWRSVGEARRNERALRVGYQG